MIFKKWFLKYGPGSAGSVARTMAKSYMQFKKTYPDFSQKDLLLRTLQTRVGAWEKHRLPSLTKAEQEKWIEIAEGSLSTLILYILRHENPGLPREALTNFEVIGVVDEVVNKYVPEDQ